MRDFIFHNPVKIYFGKGQARHIAQEVERVEGAVLVVYGGGSIKRNGAYDDVTAALREAGIRPIFTTLPPIDEVKYLACIDHNGASAAGVMQWLGDVRRIYRTQERYSGLVRTIAAELDVPCADPRERFLDGGDPHALNADDGIHLSEEGYRLSSGALIEKVRAII